MSFPIEDGADSQWLSTDKVAQKLMIHPGTLRRWRRDEVGLKDGVHFRSGFTSNSPIKWNLAELRAFITRKATMAPPSGVES